MHISHRCAVYMKIGTICSWTDHFETKCRSVSRHMTTNVQREKCRAVCETYQDREGTVALPGKIMHKHKIDMESNMYLYAH